MLIVHTHHVCVSQKHLVSFWLILMPFVVELYLQNRMLAMEVFSHNCHQG